MRVALLVVGVSLIGVIAPILYECSWWNIGCLSLLIISILLMLRDVALLTRRTTQSIVLDQLLRDWLDPKMGHIATIVQTVMAQVVLYAAGTTPVQRCRVWQSALGWDEATTERLLFEPGGIRTLFEVHAAKESEQDVHGVDVDRTKHNEEASPSDDASSIRPSDGSTASSSPLVNDIFITGYWQPSMEMSDESTQNSADRQELPSAADQLASILLRSLRQQVKERLLPTSLHQHDLTTSKILQYVLQVLPLEGATLVTVAAWAWHRWHARENQYETSSRYRNFPSGPPSSSWLSSIVGLGLSSSALVSGGLLLAKHQDVWKRVLQRVPRWKRIALALVVFAMIGRRRRGNVRTQG